MHIVMNRFSIQTKHSREFRDVFSLIITSLDRFDQIQFLSLVFRQSQKSVFLIKSRNTGYSGYNVPVLGTNISISDFA